MKQYTIVYEDLKGNAQVYMTRADGVDQAMCMFERDPDAPEFNDILHVVENPVPKVTVVLDGDMVQAAYSDSEVEIIHCYADKEAVGNALDNGLSLMPGSRHCLNYPDKADHAYPFGWVDVDHNPEAVSFDHKFATDKEMIEEFTSAVREELES